MASRAFWFYVFVIPDIFNPPSVVPDVFNPPLSFPTFSIGNPRAVPMWGHTNERTEEKDTGFPLKTVGNDKRREAGMTRGEGGNDERGGAGIRRAVAGSGHVVWLWGLTIS